MKERPGGSAGPSKKKKKSPPVIVPRQYNTHSPVGRPGCPLAGRSRCTLVINISIRMTAVLSETDKEIWQKRELAACKPHGPKIRLNSASVCTLQVWVQLHPYHFGGGGVDLVGGYEHWHDWSDSKSSSNTLFSFPPSPQYRKVLWISARMSGGCHLKWED